MQKVKNHFDSMADDYDHYKKKSDYYYSKLQGLLSSIIKPHKRVLELGCGTGTLLFKVKPKKGWGCDISPEMIRVAKNKYFRNKNLHFTTDSPKKIGKNDYDYIFMSDVIEHLSDPQDMFKQISKIMSHKTLFIITMANPIWEPALMLAEKLNLKMPEGEHKRWSYKNIKTLLNKENLKISEHNYSLLIPVYIPVVSPFANRWLEPLFKPLCFIEYVVVKKK